MPEWYHVRVENLDCWGVGGGGNVLVGVVRV